MKAVYKCPGQAPAVIDVANELKALQGLVEGHIEVVTFFIQTGADAGGETTYVALIVNEEGLLNNMRFNCNFIGKQYFGPMLFVGVDGEEFCGLTDEQADVLLRFGGF